MVNATTLIIKRIRGQEPTRWISAFATELSATLVVVVLIPLVAWFVQTLNLNWNNACWRVLWHIPGWIAFSLLHIGLFVAVRKLLWASFGGTHQFGNLWLGLRYEMRKGLIIYLAIVLVLHTDWLVLDR